MSDVTDVHYGIRYPGGFVADFDEDRAAATAAFEVMLRKQGNVELVTRKVGAWKANKHTTVTP